MSKIGKFITSQKFTDLAKEAVRDAIADLRAHGIEPVCTPLPEAPSKPGISPPITKPDEQR